MDNIDKMELSKVEVWKNYEHYTIYRSYNPPNNITNLNSINLRTKTILIGDFNAHSKTWRYQDSNNPGKILEDFINTNTMDLIYNKNDTPTFIHHTGSNTNPDLLIVSSVAEYTHRKIIEDPCSGHRVVIATIKSKNHCPESNTKHS